MKGVKRQTLSDERLLRKEICLLGRFLYERGFFVATDGNISVRLGEEILISPTGKCKGELLPDEICRVSLEGKIIEGIPSSETGLHLLVYKKRADVWAIIHAHPLFLTLLGLKEERSKLPSLSEGELEMKFIPYFPPGSRELAEAVGKAVAKDPKVSIFILKRHGVVVFGSSLKSARFQLERAEFLARLFFFARI
uniref:Class II aldolase/adducin family protein n=1 Tax=candidate division WOR-3 bacterium TaxID=2052148 RepID=A0A7C3UNQ0_UNCW3